MGRSAGSADGRRPRVVLIVGEPGSGKTTLGTQLARALRVPFLARDDVRGGLYFSLGAWTPRPAPAPSADEAVDTFLRLIETMAGLGVSCVAEYVVRRARPQDLERITRTAECVVVQTWCDDAPGRRAARDRVDPLLQRQSVLQALGYRDLGEREAAESARMASVTQAMETEFDLPLLRVRTDDGYDPDLDEIIHFATSEPFAPGSIDD